MMTCLAWWRQKKLVDQACHNFMKLVNPKNPATTSATPGATIASQLRRRRPPGHRLPAPAPYSSPCFPPGRPSTCANSARDPAGASTRSHWDFWKSTNCPLP